MSLISSMLKHGAIWGGIAGSAVFTAIITAHFVDPVRSDPQEPTKIIGGSISVNFILITAGIGFCAGFVYGNIRGIQVFRREEQYVEDDILLEEIRARLNHRNEDADPEDEKYIDAGDDTKTQYSSSASLNRFGVLAANIRSATVQNDPGFDYQRMER